MAADLLAGLNSASYGEAMGLSDIDVQDLKQHTNSVLRRVEAEEILTITIRGRNVARLVPVAIDRPGPLDHMASRRLVPPTISRPFVLPPDSRDNVDVESHLVDDRDTERW